MWSSAGGDYGLTSMEADPLACSDPPEESCSDAGCPVHGDDAGSEDLYGSDEPLIGS